MHLLPRRPPKVTRASGDGQEVQVWVPLMPHTHRHRDRPSGPVVPPEEDVTEQPVWRVGDEATWSSPAQIMSTMALLPVEEPTRIRRLSESPTGC